MSHQPWHHSAKAPSPKAALFLSEGRKMIRRIVVWSVLAACVAAGSTLAGAGGQGVGQTPGGLPLSQSIRERGSSLTGAYEGWFYGKDGATYALVGYFNRNTKQEFEIPVGPNNHIDPGGPDQGQPTHFLSG